MIEKRKIKTTKRINNNDFLVFIIMGLIVIRFMELLIDLAKVLNK